MYTLGQKFSDFFLQVSNFQINLFGLLQKMWHFVIWTVLNNLSVFEFFGVGIKDQPESKNSMFI